jgi:hypothetical protein
MKYMDRVRWLYRIVLIQKAARLILRAAWLGGAVYLFCWGINSLWGVLPNSGYWVFFSVVVGFATLITIFIKPLKLDEFLWRVDRNFAQKEQIATAYQVSRKKKGKALQPESLDGILVSEAAEMLPPITRRVIDKGWMIRLDVEATVIVLLLLMPVYLSGMESFTRTDPGSGLGLLPGLGSDPTFLDVYPSGIPGDTRGSDPGQFQAEGSYEPLGTCAPSLGLSEDGLDQVYEVFRQMGVMLKDQAATARFGRILEDGDLAQAAIALSGISENIDRLGPETRLDLAEGFDFSRRELYQLEFADITDILGRASTALRGDPLAEMGSQLDEVVCLLEALASIQGGGGVYAHSAYPEPEPPEMERIEGEGEEMEVETAEDISELLTIPGFGAEGGAEVLGDAADLLGAASAETMEFNPASYDFSWDDKDVVSSYFSPR